MLVGVVSDTHNNIKNIKAIIDIFNKEKVDLVIHTGDISKASTLEKFSDLDCELIGVFGNNDRNEEGLKEVCEKLNFRFQEPPFLINIHDKRIVIFHEPDPIKEYLNKDTSIDVVLFGHTHRYKEEIKDNVLFFNPGESASFFEGNSALGIINLKNMKIKRIFF